MGADAGRAVGLAVVSRGGGEREAGERAVAARAGVLRGAETGGVGVSKRVPVDGGHVRGGGAGRALGYFEVGARARVPVELGGVRERGERGVL